MVYDVHISIHYILLGTTTACFWSLWVISIIQLCNTDVINHMRLKKVIVVTIFSSLTTILNTMEYIRFISNYTVFWYIDLHLLCTLFQAIVIISGFHIFGSFSLAFIDKFYSVINTKRPAWIGIFYLLLQTFLIIAVLICYTFEYIFNSTTWTAIFYVILSVIIFIQAIIIVFIIKAILNIVNNIKIIEAMNGARIRSAKRTMKGAICTAITVCFISSIAALIHVEVIVDYFGLIFDRKLFDSIDHSIFLLIFTASLILWIHQKYSCGQYMLHDNSVCIQYGCGDFWFHSCYCCCGEFWYFACGECCKCCWNEHIVTPKGYKNGRMVPIAMESSTTAYNAERLLDNYVNNTPRTNTIDCVCVNTPQTHLSVNSNK